MADAFGEADSAAGSIAEGMLNLAGAGDQGPSERVVHELEGVVLDGETLGRRAAAVVALADSVERCAAAGGGGDGTRQRT